MKRLHHTPQLPYVNLNGTPMQNTLNSLEAARIVDAKRWRGKVIFRLADGREVELDETPETIEFYWRVRLEMRRRAFGL